MVWTGRGEWILALRAKAEARDARNRKKAKEPAPGRLGQKGKALASVQSDPPIRTGIETYLSTHSDRVLARTFAVLPS